VNFQSNLAFQDPFKAQKKTHVKSLGICEPSIVNNRKERLYRCHSNECKTDLEVAQNMGRKKKKTYQGGEQWNLTLFSEYKSQYYPWDWYIYLH